MNLVFSDVPGNSSTGNGTWEIYQSMGVCSSVVDVSSSITSEYRKRSTQYHPIGCNYSAPAIDRDGTPSSTTMRSRSLGDTLWVGASYDRQYPDVPRENLVQFYVIYAPDLAEWSAFDYAEDHKDRLIALEASLSLCMNTYITTMKSGVTTTNLTSSETNIDWKPGKDVLGGTEYETVATTYDSETFWIYWLNVLGFRNYMSIVTFIGSAQYRPANPGEDDGNATSSDTIGVIASSVYDDNAGIGGLSELLDKLAISMTNGYVSRSPLLKLFLGLREALPGCARPRMLPQPYLESLQPTRSSSKYNGFG